LPGICLVVYGQGGHTHGAVVFKRDNDGKFQPLEYASGTLMEGEHPGCFWSMSSTFHPDFCLAMTQRVLLRIRPWKDRIADWVIQHPNFLNDNPTVVGVLAGISKNPAEAMDALREWCPERRAELDTDRNWCRKPHPTREGCGDEECVDCTGPHRIDLSVFDFYCFICDEE